jgi:putative tricarboxylic transport membrane protein
MDLFGHLAQGLATAISPENLVYCFLGVLIGTLVGVLPGVGPIAGMSLLIPATFGMNPTTAMIMLAGIYYGAMYGGSTTSILINVPGEAASVVTALDGYQMARAGRAGPALTISAVGSFVAGTFSIVMLMILAPLLAQLALKVGPPEYFALMILGFVLLAYLGPRGRWSRRSWPPRWGCSWARWASSRCRATVGSPSACPSSGKGSASCQSSWGCSGSPRCSSRWSAA